MWGGVPDVANHGKFHHKRSSMLQQLKINLSLEPNCRCSSYTGVRTQLLTPSIYFVLRFTTSENRSLGLGSHMINAPVDMVENVYVYVAMATQSDVTAAGAVPESWRERLVLQLINSN